MHANVEIAGATRWGRLWALAMGLLTVSFLALAGERVRITNGEWPPYLSAHLPHYGTASRIVTEAFRVEGIEVDYGFFPWKRAYRLAESGAWDGAAGWMKSPEREERFYFSEPVIASGFVWFYRKGDPFDWTSMEDLAGLRMGATLEYDYGPAFNKAERDGIFAVERVSRDELNFRKLLIGRIDAFPMDPVVGLDMLRRHHSPEEAGRITYHPLPLREEPLFLLLSRDVPGNAELMRRFNRGLRTLHQSGVIDRILLEELGDVTMLPRIEEQDAPAVSAESKP